jgi:hypothetical protein
LDQQSIGRDLAEGARTSKEARHSGTLIERGLAAVAALIAGRLADSSNLTEALVWTSPFPWLICAAIYSLFYWSNPHDSARQRALMAQRAQELAA